MNAYEGKRLGLQWSLTQHLEDLDYADDLCLPTHRLADMKVKGERLQETGGQVGLKINIQKTKEMRIGVRQQEPLELHGEAERKSVRVHVFGKHHQWNWRNWRGHNSQDKESAIDILDAYACVEEKCIRLQTKLRIFDTNVKSALRYGSETFFL